MPRINFDDLVLIEDWANALDKILAEAKTAINTKDAAGRLDLQELLRTYIKRSPTECELLDTIASKAVNDLMIVEVRDALDGITSRNDELRKATELMKGITAQARKDAKAIQFENVIESLNNVKVAVETLKKLQTELGEPDQSLVKRVQEISSAIESLLRLADPAE